MSDTPTGHDQASAEDDDPVTGDPAGFDRARAGFIGSALARRTSTEGVVLRRGLITGFLDASEDSTSDTPDPSVRDALDAVRRMEPGGDAHPAGAPDDEESALRLARALDRVDRRRRQRWERRLPPGAGSDEPSSGGSVVDDWRREMRELLWDRPDKSLSTGLETGSSLEALVERSLDATEDQTRQMIEEAGASWASYRTLYRAARVESARDPSWRADEHVSGVLSIGGAPVGFSPAVDEGVDRCRPPLKGRSSVLRSIIARICVGGPTLTFLVGRAGIGKSAVADHVAHSVRAFGLATFRVSAPDTNALVASLERIAEGLEIPLAALQAAHRLSETSAEYADRLWKLLDEAERDWLVVVDDVPTDAAEMPGWFREPRGGNVLVVSRCTGLLTWPAQSVHVLDELSTGDAEALLAERLRRGAGPSAGLPARALRDVVHRVCVLLPGLPLALASVGELLASARREDLTGWVDHLASQPWDDAVEAIYSTCLGALGPDRDSGRKLLRLIASFAPDEPLPTRILDGIEERTLPGGVDGLAALVQVGLLEQVQDQDDRDSLRLHPAIAEFARRDFGDDELVALIDGRAVELLERESASIDPGRPSDWSVALVLEPHVHEVVESPALGLGKVSAEQGARVLLLADHIATALMRAGLHEYATVLLDRALHRFAWLGSEHPALLTADLTRSWMIALDRGGDIPRARSRIEHQLTVLERVVGPDAPTTVAARDTLGWLLGEQDELVEAREVLREVIRRRCAEKPPAIRELLASRHRLAWINVMIGDGESAVEEFWDVLVERLRLFGSDHLDVMSTRYRLAWALSRLGRHDQARNQFQDLLEQAEITLGPQHQLALMVRSRIAWAAMWAGDLHTARNAYAMLLPEQEKVLGADHRRVLVNAHNLAMLTMRLGDPAAAEEQLRVVVSTRDGLMGSDHPLSMDSREMHAWALHRAGRDADAERELRALLADRGRVLGDHHPATLDVRHRMARVVLHRGRLSDAERQLRDLLADQQCVLRSQDPRILRTQHSLALALGLQGRHSEAFTLLRSVLAAQTMIVGSEDEDTLSTRDRIVWLSGVSGRLDGLVELASHVLSARERKLGGNHPHTDTSRYRRAWSLLWTGRVSEASSEYTALVDRLEHTRPERHPHLLRARLGLVQAQRLTGRLTQARVSVDELVDTIRATHGTFAVATLRAEEERAQLCAAMGDLEGAALGFRRVRLRQACVMSPEHFDVQRVSLLENGARQIPVDAEPGLPPPAS